MANTLYEHMADSIVDLMREAILLTGGNSEMIYDECHRILSSIHNEEYLRWVHGFFKQLLSGGVRGKSYAREIINAVDLSDRRSMRIAKAHQEDSKFQSIPIVTIVTLIEKLIVNGVASLNDDGGLDSFAAHFKAQVHYNYHFYRLSENTEVNESLFHYYDNIVYSTAVELHADHVDRLLAYRNLKGLVITPQGYDAYDESEFLEYLSHGAVTDGWL